MSTWVEGRAYRYEGDQLRCVRRWFDGPMEMVDLVFVVEAPAEMDVFTRTARALAPCVAPRVTATLGGVTSPATCDHRFYGRVLADAGPHAGAECCEACGMPARVPESSEGGRTP